jgi:hypothetical protein
VHKVRGFVKLFQTQTKPRPMHGSLGYVMDNVIAFPTKTNEHDEDAGDPVTDFIHYHLIPWAIETGLDINSNKFKLNGATIMTCLQGMLLDDI